MIRSRGVRISPLSRALSTVQGGWLNSWMKTRYPTFRASHVLGTCLRPSVVTPTHCMHIQETPHVSRLYSSVPDEYTPEYDEYTDSDGPYRYGDMSDGDASDGYEEVQVWNVMDHEHSSTSQDRPTLPLYTTVSIQYEDRALSLRIPPGYDTRALLVDAAAAHGVDMDPRKYVLVSGRDASVLPSSTPADQLGKEAPIRLVPRASVIETVGQEERGENTATFPASRDRRGQQRGPQHGDSVSILTPYEIALRISDMQKPQDWYPLARDMKRKVYIHEGPTNSGKTHNALNSLSNSTSGVYCGPLRLLASEIYHRLSERGLAIDLLTGQEHIKVDGAQHVSCTVEMAAVNKVIDVAVVDEVQMIADRSRGWAWTRAVLGIPCRELHLCGDGTATRLLAELCREGGDEVSIIQHERLSPLSVQPHLKGGLKSLAYGDAVVAFSRRELFALQREIESETDLRCSIIYGALPPEARLDQARKFNQDDGGSDVIVATDALGMGLNLNIRRVIFATLEKFDGVQRRSLTPQEAKQIGGRAGRYGGRFPKGHVTALSRGDARYLKHLFQQPVPPIESAGLFPMSEAVHQFVLRVRHLSPSLSLSLSLSFLASPSFQIRYPPTPLRTLVLTLTLSIPTTGIVFDTVPLAPIAAIQDGL